MILSCALAGGFMSQVVPTTILVILLSTLQTFAFETQVFMQDGLKAVQTSLSDQFSQQLSGDQQCPAQDSETVENLALKNGKIMSAISTVQAVITEIDPEVSRRQQDQSRCGACRQENIVSSFVAVHAEKIKDDARCDNRPMETLVQEFTSKQEVQNYSAAVLQGRNEEGERMAANCPNPCVYFITTAQTPLPSGNIHLTLTIQCGHPRKDGILSAIYNFHAGVIHQWTCRR
jgi:hypothetical protein